MVAIASDLEISCRAKASSTAHARILESIGQEYIRLAPHLHLASIRVGATRVGEDLNDLELLDRFELRCLGPVRAGTYIDCADVTALAEDDALLVVGTRENVRTFSEKL